MQEVVYWNYDHGTDQLGEEVGRLGGHAGVHAEALDVFQV